MIWVNDFGTLSKVPKWLEHAKLDEDYLGFSDVIFPLFLFIVGLSIPFAIDHRIQKKESGLRIIKHILIRTLALLVIGVFMVNYETAHSKSMLISKSWWCFLMALGVVLIWMYWKKSPVPKKWHIVLQGLGILILLFLAIIYKGGSEGELWMTTQWWGILGLIGWAYGSNSLLYLLHKGNIAAGIFIWVLFFSLSIVMHLHNAPEIPEFLRYFSVVLNGTLPAFTAAGVMTTLLFRKLKKIKISIALLIIALLGIFNLIFGIISRPLWGISKIGETPSWLGICTGIGMLLFLLLYYITDIKKHTDWAKLIAPAGTATLTCYMIPYFIYPLREITGLRLPEILNTAVIGLIISFIFALLVVIVTGWFEKKGFKLKL